MDKNFQIICLKIFVLGQNSCDSAQWLQQLLAEQRSADEEYIDEAITEGSEAKDRNVEVEKCYHLRKREKIKAPAYF